MKIENQEKQQDILPSVAQEMKKFLDAIELAFRVGDAHNLHFVVFVWAQRQDYIMAGTETFEDQKIPKPYLGGVSPE